MISEGLEGGDWEGGLVGFSGYVVYAAWMYEMPACDSSAEGYVI